MAALWVNDRGHIQNVHSKATDGMPFSWVALWLLKVSLHEAVESNSLWNRIAKIVEFSLIYRNLEGAELVEYDSDRLHIASWVKSAFAKLPQHF